MEGKTKPYGWKDDMEFALALVQLAIAVIS